MPSIYTSLMQIMNASFSKDPQKRVFKLHEEVDELREAVLDLTHLSQERQKAAIDPKVKTSEFNDIEEHFLDELADASAVLAHLIHLSGYTYNDTLKRALHKIRNRVTDENYKRIHPHIKTEGDL